MTWHRLISKRPASEPIFLPVASAALPDNQVASALSIIAVSVLAGICLVLGHAIKYSKCTDRVSCILATVACASFISIDFMLAIFGEHPPDDSAATSIGLRSSILALFMAFLLAATHLLYWGPSSRMSSTCALITVMVCLLLHAYTSDALEMGSSHSKIVIYPWRRVSLKLSSFNLWSHLAACQVALFGALARIDNTSELLSNMGTGMLPAALWLAAAQLERQPSGGLSGGAYLFYAVALLCQLRTMGFIGKSLLHCFAPVRTGIVGPDDPLSSKRVSYTMCALVLFGWVALPISLLSAHVGLFSDEQLDSFLAFGTVFVNGLVPLTIVNCATVWRVRAFNANLAAKIQHSDQIANYVDRFRKSAKGDLAMTFQGVAGHVGRARHAMTALDCCRYPRWVNQKAETIQAVEKHVLAVHRFLHDSQTCVDQLGTAVAVFDRTIPNVCDIRRVVSFSSASDLLSARHASRCSPRSFSDTNLASHA